MKKRLSIKVLAVIISLSFIIGIVPCVLAVDSLQLTATYGDTLSDVSLPGGYSWSAENPESVEVGNVGASTFAVIHNVDGVNTEETAVVTVFPAYISEVSLQTDGSQYYTGDPGEPDVKLFFKGKELIKDTDYTVSFESAGAGIAKVTVEGIGNFQGKTSLSVNIEKQDAVSVSINKTELKLKPGESEQLTATVSPSNATFKDVIWSSSDEDVAVVDENGNVQAIGNGEATITAETKDGGFTAECEVTVKTDVDGISLPAETVCLYVEETYQLNAEITPNEASKKDVVWSSDDESVVTVDESGKLNAVEAGKATITAETVDGGFKAQCLVVVLSNSTGIKIPTSKVRLFYKENYQLEAIINPYVDNSKGVVWSSGDESVVTVDENGLLTAVGRGNATITAATADGKFSDTCEVSVRYTWWQTIIWIFLGCLWYFK